LLAERGVKLALDTDGRALLRSEIRPENFHCVLQILLANALDWLNPTQGPRIRISAEVVEDVCLVVFADNGPGLPDGAEELVFEPLFSRKEGGRGMGLTMARQLLESHGGSIAARAQGRRKGAHFVLTLPRKRARATIIDPCPANATRQRLNSLLPLL
jgi:signal transduction histidine kinase